MPLFRSMWNFAHTTLFSCPSSDNPLTRKPEPITAYRSLMESVIKLPIDLDKLPPFRAMRSALGLERTLYVWFVLWQELAYRAQEGNGAGRLPKTELPSFLTALEPVEPDPVKREKLLDQVLSAKLLLPDGDDYVCPRFMVLHGEMGPQRSQAQRGGDMRAYRQRMKKSEGEAFQQSLLISGGKLVDEEGLPLPAEDVRRLTRLIVACDNALYKSPRPPFAFTEGLIQDARAVLRRFADEQIDYVCTRVALHRNHPALNGLTTEKLLPMFGDIAQRMETT